MHGVAREQLADSGFWLLAFRPLFLPASAHAGPAALYDQLLPSLTGRPLLAHHDAATARWRPSPLSGDVSHANLALEALEASASACGMTSSQAAYVAVLWKWAALQLALRNRRVTDV